MNSLYGNIHVILSKSVEKCQSPLCIKLRSPTPEPRTPPPLYRCPALNRGVKKGNMETWIRFCPSLPLHQAHQTGKEVMKRSVESGKAESPPGKEGYSRTWNPMISLLKGKR